MKIGRLRCVTISPSRDLSIRLADVVSETTGVELVKELREYPDEPALRRLLLFGAPDIIFLDTANAQQAADVAVLLDHLASRAQVIAICDGDSNVLGTLMRAGVREHVENAFDRQSLADAIVRASVVLSRGPAPAKEAGQVVSFMPAKPGVGASTIAANTSLALSRIQGVRAFLGDFDTGSGILGFIFKLNHGYSLSDALSNAHELDDALWTRLAARVEDLDILPADCEVEHRFDFERVTHLIDHLRRVYTVSCLDLPGQMDQASIAVLRESSKIYLVCTQELTCLHMLRRKAAILRKLGLEDKVQVLVNRYDKKDVMKLEQIAEVVGCKVVTTLPNDYKQSTVGSQIGTNVDPKGALGKGFERVAHAILHLDPPKRPARRKFVEYFALRPGIRNSVQAAG
jgi:pilus assembly protein CpaE